MVVVRRVGIETTPLTATFALSHHEKDCFGGVVFAHTDLHVPAVGGSFSVVRCSISVLRRAGEAVGQAFHKTQISVGREPFRGGVATLSLRRRRPRTERKSVAGILLGFFQKRKRVQRLYIAAVVCTGYASPCVL